MNPAIVITFALAAVVFAAAYFLEGCGPRRTTPAIASAIAVGGPIVLIGGWLVGHVASFGDLMMLVTILLAAAGGSYLSSRRPPRPVSGAVKESQGQASAERSLAKEPATGPVSDNNESFPASG